MSLANRIRDAIHDIQSGLDDLDGVYDDVDDLEGLEELEDEVEDLKEENQRLNEALKAALNKCYELGAKIQLDATDHATLIAQEILKVIE